MDSLTNVKNILDFIAAIFVFALSIRTVQLYLKGLVQTRYFMTLIGIYGAIFLGSSLLGALFDYAMSSRGGGGKSVTSLHCEPVWTYWSCNGWPIFTDWLYGWLQTSLGAIQFFFNMSHILAVIAAAIYLFMQLNRTIWMESDHIIKTFLGAGFIFALVYYNAEIGTALKSLFSSFYSLAGASGEDSYKEAHDILRAWNDFYLNYESQIDKKAFWNPTKYMSYFSKWYSEMVFYFPLAFFSSLSFLYIFGELIVIKMLPAVAFIASLSASPDAPMRIFGVLVSLGVYGFAQHMLWWIISFYPKPPEILMDAIKQENFIVEVASNNIVLYMSFISMLFVLILTPICVMHVLGSIVHNVGKLRSIGA